MTCVLKVGKRSCPVQFKVFPAAVPSKYIAVRFVCFAHKTNGRSDKAREKKEKTSSTKLKDNKSSYFLIAVLLDRRYE